MIPGPLPTACCTSETLEYRITYTNNSDAPVRSMTVNDTTPSYTSFVSATAESTPATLTACMKSTPANALPAPAGACTDAQPVGGTGPIDWKFAGFVAPGGTGASRGGMPWKTRSSFSGA